MIETRTKQRTDNTGDREYINRDKGFRKLIKYIYRTRCLYLSRSFWQQIGKLDMVE